MTNIDNLVKYSKFNYKAIDIQHDILNELEHLSEMIRPEPMPGWIEEELGPFISVDKIHDIRILLLGLRMVAEQMRSDLVIDYPHIRKNKLSIVFQNILSNSGLYSRFLGRLISIEKGSGYAKFSDIDDIIRVISWIQGQGAVLSGLQRSYLERKDKTAYLKLLIGNMDDLERRLFFEHLQDEYKDVFKKVGKSPPSKEKTPTPPQIKIETVTPLPTKDEEDDEKDGEEELPLQESDTDEDNS